MAATKQVASILIILFLLPLSKSLGTVHHPVQWHGSGTQLLVTTDIKFDNGRAISSSSVSHSVIIDHEGRGGSTTGGNGGNSQGDDPGTKSGAGAANMHQHHHGDTSRLQQHSATTTFILILSILGSLLLLV